MKDIVALASEGSPGPDFVEVMVLAMKGGKLTADLPKLAEIQGLVKTNLEMLPQEYKREAYGEYSVVFSDKLLALQRKIISEIRTRQAQTGEIMSAKEN